jgi:hypothetical protein
VEAATQERRGAGPQYETQALCRRGDDDTAFLHARLFLLCLAFGRSAGSTAAYYGVEACGEEEDCAGDDPFVAC